MSSSDDSALVAPKRADVVKVIHCGPDAAVITCLIGSPKFRAEFQSIAKAYALDGEIVLSPNVWTDTEGIRPAEQERLHQVTLQRIQMADKVFVVNPNNRIPETVYKEIEYAESLGRIVTYLETPAK